MVSCMNDKRPPPDQLTTRRLLLIYMGWVVAVTVFWLTPLSYPLRLLATLVHELGHLSAVVLSGGEIFGMRVQASGAGHVLSLGGARWLVSPAGYVGLLFASSFLFWCSTSAGSARFGLGLLLVVLLVYTVVAAGTLGVLLTLTLTTVVTVVLLWTGSALLQTAAARFVAICLAIEGILDYWRILFTYGEHRSRSVWAPVKEMPGRDDFYTDATLMAASYGGSEGLWAVIWLVLSVGALAVGIAWSVYEELRLQQETALAADRLRQKLNFRKGEGKEHRVR